ncbi:MAG: DUF3500 domain-containing protein [Chloroflexi bacterium]|nr:DUF3500 domain-containing protein [Chloroflexota bacterium]
MVAEVGVTHRAPRTAASMAAAAQRFLGSLDEPRRKATQFAFEDQERFRWNYRPDGFFIDGATFWHEGLRLINMTPEQQQAALALLDAGVSARTAARARAIMSLETYLREQERVVPRWVPHVCRDPELYAFSIFGEPGGKAPWAWRAGGHHIGFHVTVIDGDQVATTPFFLGANPAIVRHGTRDLGMRTLPEEEDLGRALLQSLAPERKLAAIVSPKAPTDILTDAYRTANPSVPPRGLTYAAMSGEERGKLIDLVKLYVGRATDEVAENEWRRIEAAGLDGITFAWLGSEEIQRGHYYAVKGPTFAIEYDNTQDDATHIHSVWRNYANDWGEDLLVAHYAAEHR